MTNDHSTQSAYGGDTATTDINYSTSMPVDFDSELAAFLETLQRRKLNSTPEEVLATLNEFFQGFDAKRQAAAPVFADNSAGHSDLQANKAVLDPVTEFAASRPVASFAAEAARPLNLGADCSSISRSGALSELPVTDDSIADFGSQTQSKSGNESNTKPPFANLTFVDPNESDVSTNDNSDYPSLQSAIGKLFGLPFSSQEGSDHGSDVTLEQLSAHRFLNSMDTTETRLIDTGRDSTRSELTSEEPLPYSQTGSPLKEISPSQLAGDDFVPHEWLWEGYLMRGAITVMMSQGKVGKTTLLSLILKKLETGGTLAGMPIGKGRALVLTEESASIWNDRQQKLQFGDNIRFHVLQTSCRELEWYWERINTRCNRLAFQQELELVVFDPMSNFLPYHDENSARQVQFALNGLRTIANYGVSILLIHHPNKSIHGPSTAAGRGSSVVGSLADIIIHKREYPHKAPSDRRRVLHAWSRFLGTPATNVIEWTPNGLDYIRHGSLEETADKNEEQTLLAVLRRAGQPLTHREILAEWPRSVPRPAPSSLYRRLNFLSETLLILQTGEGTRTDPCRYSIGLEERVNS